MRLSCNFVNVYTIAYRVQYTFTRVHARIPNGQPREEKRAARVLVESADKWARIVVTRACSARGKLNGEVGEDVHVGVAVGPMGFKLNHWIK